MNTVRLYQNEVNIVDEVAKTLLLESKLERYHSNAIVPLFLMIKRLIVWYPHLARDIEQKKNVFDCQYEQQLFAGDEMKNLLAEMKTRIDTFNIYFDALYYELEEMQRHTPDPDVTEQLSRNWGDNFLPTYRQALLNYVISLRQETQQRWQQPQLKEMATLFQKFTVNVLDCLLIDDVFRGSQHFDFYTYEELNKALSFEQREEVIDAKLALAFTKV
jgi:hypothetical protein